MKSVFTSYNGLFSSHEGDAPVIRYIEIPIIQRDYAQGRNGATVQRIRAAFLDAIHAALTGPDEISLDFVYGDVEQGTLRPLDGQQRLTTLFLLHWYLAARCDRLDQEQGWKRFSYATRPSSRRFCEQLVEHRPPADVKTLSAWVVDQPWFLFGWERDPTISSMLVVLDALHNRFAAADCMAAWHRLVDPQEPAISFHLLPIEKLGLSEELYIKMNSRGKPLTPFECFKARFEQLIENSCPEEAGRFASKVDTVWSDLLWRYRGDDNLIDDEFLRYFRFVTEVCAWRDGGTGEGEDDELAARIYGPANPRATEHLAFLLQAFDTWVGVDISAYFESLLALPAPGVSDPTRVTLFGVGQKREVDLFEACCRSYGDRRSFGLAQTLLLHAVVLHRLRSTPDFPRRLRVLRNLLEASGSELRLERMPSLVADVEHLVLEGSLDRIHTLNQAQVADERLKAELLVSHPELAAPMFQLEDHPVLRGNLASFELGPAVFLQRAETFHRLFADSVDREYLTAALLATGDYSQRQPNRRFFLFGTLWKDDGPWRRLLSSSGRGDVGRTRSVLGQLLDEAAAGDDLRGTMQACSQRFLVACEQNQTLDWRYYFVKYRLMRESWTGIYAGLDGRLSYSICMLNRYQMNSNYRDPYLLAVHRTSGVGAAVYEPWFTGYETEPRWMQLVKSGAALRCVERGFELQPPGASAHAEAFARVCQEHGVTESNLLPVRQVERDGRLVDTQDRVQLGAALLRALVAAGL